MEGWGGGWGGGWGVGTGGGGLGWGAGGLDSYNIYYHIEKILPAWVLGPRNFRSQKVNT